ncbi:MULTISPECIES: HIT family protein [Halobacterium]|uniref:Histidine triad family protein (Homolog tobis(5'-nucleosyl)-tetraphosphatase) n=4 Tax=Halobacterium salinarum TaxID=2242 RepID=Q9HNA0_HALSA|nr:HIT family protein [Halobacterium salinarum]AAG20321.1 histidine triad protein [Halobacterium salinarum NRC-1]MBB6089339.1 histidine triad (HIT) family protein [Halobacterium salinarum]MCF2166392.1 HIT family protein [Halobacterium salinarum]MCF2167291.1 HIT family protein [Halobacterium salinarum]MCF2208486.1 HIT family protein [Halobacterium salinarum]
MSDDCVFCQIIADEIPARVVHEDADTLAFLDATPMAPGHTLVIPKTHAATLADTPGDDATAVFETLHALAPTVEAAVDADATTIGFNNGTAAGQEVPHVHGHIIPRFADDDGGPLHVAAGTRPDVSDADLDATAADITDRLA